MELPAVGDRVAHALAHDVQAPLGMLLPVLDLESTTASAGRLRDGARSGVVQILDTVAALERALRATTGTAASTPCDGVETAVRAAWDEAARPDDALALEVRVGLPVDADAAAVLCRDLVGHACAGSDRGPVHVTITVRPDGGSVTVAVSDDGPEPVATPAGRVRAVHGSAAVALLAAQRVAEAAGGRITTGRDGAVHVTLPATARPS